MKTPVKAYSILHAIIGGQIVVTLLLTFASSPLCQLRSNGKTAGFCECSPFVNLKYVLTSDEKRDILEYEGYNKESNFTLLGFYDSQQLDSFDTWLRSFLLLRIPSTIKILVSDLQTERFLQNYILNNFHPKFDVPRIEITAMEMNEPISSSAYIWSERLKVLISQLLVDQDVLVVNMSSIWLKDPMPLIWQDYGNFHLWGSGYSTTGYLNLKFLYFKAKLLNVRVVGQLKERLVAESNGEKQLGNVISVILNVIVKKYKRTHHYKVKTLDTELFPSVTTAVDTEWINKRKTCSYILIGTNLGQLRPMLGLPQRVTGVIESENRSFFNIPNQSDVKDAVDSRREMTVTILSVTNTGFLDFTQNWLQSLNILGRRFKVKLLAEDLNALSMLQKIADRAIIDTRIDLRVEMVKNFSSMPLSFFEKAYMDLVNSRPEELLRELEFGQDVLFVDVDAVWLRDPLPLIWRYYGDYDVFVATGHDHHTPCPCFLYLKCSLLNIDLVRDWTLRLKRLASSPRKSKHENDMQALAVILDKYRRKHALRVHKLDRHQFPTGDFYFKEPTFYDNHKNEVYVVHGNRLGAHRTKLYFFKLFNLWFSDTREYRDSPFFTITLK